MHYIRIKNLRFFVVLLLLLGRGPHGYLQQQTLYLCILELVQGFDRAQLCNICTSIWSSTLPKGLFFCPFFLFLSINSVNKCLNLCLTISCYSQLFPNCSKICKQIRKHLHFICYEIQYIFMLCLLMLSVSSEKCFQVFQV